MTNEKFKVFCYAACAEFISYFIIVLNTRAFTGAHYFWTFITDSFFITQSFMVSKWMIEAKEARGYAGYFGFLLGGTLGSLAAIWISKILYGS